MKTIKIRLKSEIEHHADDLEFFVNTMVRKLYTNRHKEGLSPPDPALLLEGLKKETLEMVKAIREEGQFEAATENVDIANMAFLMAVALWTMTRPEYESFKNRMRVKT